MIKTKKGACKAQPSENEKKIKDFYKIVLKKYLN